MSGDEQRDASYDDAERRLNSLFWIALAVETVTWSLRDVLSWNLCFAVGIVMEAVMWATILAHHPASKRGKIVIAALVALHLILSAVFV
jgi:uncharacterized membrane protein